MSLESTIAREAIRQYRAPRNLRKRFLVSEGDLFTLYKEVMQVRKIEEREAFLQRFKTLMEESVPVKMVKQQKGGTSCP